MSTQISELFVAIGVKGSEKTLSALANTRMSISSIASTSLEAKAAILGMAYALERLTTSAAADADQFLRTAVEFTKSKRISRDLQNVILQQFGLSPDLIGKIESGQFKLSNVDHAPILSNKEIDSLSNVQSQFAGVEEKVRLFFGHFTAKHGNEIVKIIQDMTTAFLELANVLIIIADKLQIFQAIDNVFKGWGTILQFADDFLSGKKNDKNFLDKALIPSKKDTIDLYKSIQKDFQVSKLINKLPSLGDGIEDWIYTSKKNLNSGYGEFAKDIPRLFNRNGYDILKGAPVPSVPDRYTLAPKNSNINVTQNISMTGDPTDYNDIQNMQMTALQKGIIDTMSQFDRGRQT